MPKDRLISLDVFRGITIAAMILVNDPGSWSYVYAPLMHSEWNGCTPTDLIFPFFLFIVGISITLSRKKDDADKSELYRKIIKRSLLIFLIGILLNFIQSFDLSTLRIPGVLQRIAIVFFVCALVYHTSNFRTQLIVTTFILVLYNGLIMLIPVPGIGEVVMEPGQNLVAWLDNLLLPGHLWSVTKTWDPEGILSTLPAISSGLTGMLTGQYLFSNNDRSKLVYHLFVIANAMIIAAIIWDVYFPINKSMWTSSYVLYTTGIAMDAFLMLFWLLDIKKIRPAAFKAFEVFGSNAITAYVMASVLATIMYAVSISDQSLQDMIFDQMSNWIWHKHLASLIYAILFVIVIYIPIHQLYTRKIFIKV